MRAVIIKLGENQSHLILTSLKFGSELSKQAKVRSKKMAYFVQWYCIGIIYTHNIENLLHIYLEDFLSSGYLFLSVKTVFVISVAGKASNKLIRYILNYFTG